MENCSSCATPLSVQCTLCKRKFSSYTVGLRHLKEVCIQPKAYKCNECEFIGCSVVYIKNHIKRKHTVIDKKDYFKCAHCERGFKNKSSLKKHLKNVCVKKFKCAYCPYKTSMSSSFRRHLKFHLKGISAIHHFCVIIV